MMLFFKFILLHFLITFYYSKIKKAFLKIRKTDQHFFNILIEYSINVLLFYLFRNDLLVSYYLECQKKSVKIFIDKIRNG